MTGWSYEAFTIAYVLHTLLHYGRLLM